MAKKNKVASAAVASREEVEALQTGEDAIAFFVRHGDISPVKVIYCTRPADDAPYDLVVIPEDQAHNEYFVVSTSGVLHVRPGQLSELVRLDVWMRERHAFRLLTAMPLVKLYRPRKYLDLWRASVRHLCYERQRQLLSQGCLLARPAYVQPVLDVRRAAYRIEALQLLCFPDEECQLADFEALQPLSDGQLPSKIRQEVDRRHLQIVAVLDKLATALKRDLETEAPGSEDLLCGGHQVARSALALGGGSGTGAGAGAMSRQSREVVMAAEVLVAAAGRAAASTAAGVGRGGKGPSIAEAKHEAKERERRRLAARRNWCMVRSSIYLADYIVQSSFVSAAEFAARELRRQLEARKHPLLLILASSGAEDFCLEPSAATFKQVSGRLKRRIVQIGRTLPLGAASKDLRNLCRDACSPSGEPVVRRVFEGLLAGGGVFAECFAKAQEALASQLRMASNFAMAQWAPCRRIQAFGRSFDEDAYARRKHTCCSLKADLSLMQEFNSIIERMRPTYHSGALHLDGSRLRNDISRIPGEALVVIRDTAVVVARESCAAANQVADTMAKMLEDRTRSERGIAEVCEELKHAVLDLGDLHKLLSVHRIRVPQNDQLNYSTLLAREEHLLARMEDRDGVGRLITPRPPPMKMVRSPSTGSTASTDGVSTEATGTSRASCRSHVQPRVLVSVEVDMTSSFIPLSCEDPPLLERLLSDEELQTLKLSSLRT